MTLRSRRKPILAALLALALLVVVYATADAAMRSERLAPKLCKTTGGGRFVAIPGFPGERIDRRLLRDVRMLVRRYKIFITDGFSTDPVHSAMGEHPLGLALDIVPNRAAGGTWKDVSRLARWAEPQQNRPRPPFRWVGYDGDAGHGRGHHLHLSWSHSGGSFGKPVRSVYSIRCPGAARKNGGGKGSGPKPKPKPKPKPGATGGIGSSGGKSPREPRGSGGIEVGGVDRSNRGPGARDRSRETGGIGVR
jgi:hypothetical protein